MSETSAGQTPPAIQVLPDHVADLIAAGEVVERPGSVVKELVENAVDAGARHVTVELKNGGMTLIRVTDDGRGIPADQCRTAFLRHATSKLRGPEDLSGLVTMGFRGEALASIAAVARVELFTRTADNAMGKNLVLEGGKVISEELTGCPLGTTMVVRDLFSHIPARLKFMKRNTVETGIALGVVQRQAMAHPEISFRFFQDGRRTFFSPGDGQLRAALYAVLGREETFYPLEGSGEGLTVTGFLSAPFCCRGNRSHQFFFVNSRPINSRLISSALEKAYENRRMVGKYPSCLISLALRPSQVDVNIHPAKTQVRFLFERKIFDAVYYAAAGALDREEGRPALTLPSTPPEAEPQTEGESSSPWGFTPLEPQREPVREVPPPSVRTREEADREEADRGSRVSPSESRRAEGLSLPRKTGEEAAEARPLQTALPLLRPEARAAWAGVPAEESTPDESGEKPDFSREIVEKPVENVEKSPKEPLRGPSVPWRLAGEVFQTYLIAEQGDTVYLIDKHAAHERMLFDRMKAAGYRPMSQTLLTPLIFTPGPEEGAVLLENLPLLDRLGFACEAFGAGAIAVRAAPDYLTREQLAPTLGELAARLREGQPPGVSPLDSLLPTMACKAAIKGGQKNSREELEVVVKAVLEEGVRYCPHGRPVAVTLTRGQLEKQFGRT